jgi:hypothetical protein
MGTWETVGAEIWRSTTITAAFINPSTVNYRVDEYPLTYYLKLGAERQHITYTTVAEWMAKRNITVAAGGFSGSPEIFYIEDAFNLTTVENQTSLITANGTFLLFGADGKLKAVRTVLNNHEWLTTNDPEVNNGWTIKAGATSGQVKVSEISGIVAEGDYIIVTTSATGKQEGALRTARDFLAYHFMGTWETVGAEIWRSTTITAAFINPANTVLKIKAAVVTAK